MAQKFYRPNKHPSDKGGVYDAEKPVDLPTSRASSEAKDRADSALSDIDEVLTENDNFRKDLSSNESGTDDLKSAEESAENPKPTEAEESEKQIATSDGIIGEGFRDEGGRKKKKGRLSRNQKIFGGIGAGIIVSSLIALFFMLTPILRLESYMQRINQRAFAYGASAVEARMSNLFDRYMISHILNMESCRASRSIDCKVNYSDQGIAKNLFTNWQDARVEEKIFDRMGFSIESRNNADPVAGVHRFTLKDRRGQTISFSNVDDWDKFKREQFTGGSRVLGREIRSAMKEEFKWYEVMQRRSVRKYLARKHNIDVWCFWACAGRDNIDDKTTDIKVKYKYKFVERFVYPFSGKYGFILDCMVSGTPGQGNCDVNNLRKRGVDRNKLDDEAAEEVVKMFTEKADLNLTQIVLESLLKRVMTSGAARAVVSTIPIAGQVYLGLSVVSFVDKADQFIENNGMTHFSAEINASQYLEFYTGMRTINDEMKSHELSLEEVGVVMDDFDGAEQSKVYQAYNTPNSTVSHFDNKVYAQETSSDEAYKCIDGDPIPDDELVCEEKTLHRTYAIEDLRDNDLVDGIIGAVNTMDNCIHVIEIGGRCAARIREPVNYVLNTVNGISDFVVGPFADAFMTLARNTPGIGSLVSYAQEKFAEFTNAVFGRIFPLPVGIDSPGREKYDGLEAGADVASSQFGEGGYTESGERYGLGAPKLSDSEATAIMSDQLDQKAYESNNSSFVARIFDIENPNSLASRAVMSTPTNKSQVVSGFASGMLNIFSNIGSSFTQLFIYKAHAQSSLQMSFNAFGVTRYGYPIGDPAFTRDPSLLTPKYCEEMRLAREASGEKNELTGFTEYSVADPCQLEDVVVEAGGALFTNE